MGQSLKKPLVNVGRTSPLRQDVNTDHLDDRLGPLIRETRKARDITLQQLAKATKLSVGYLSEIERGITSPAITALHDIATALDVTVGWFFQNEAGVDPAERGLILRAVNRRSLSYSSGITDQLLSPHLQGQLEMLLSRFPPGTGSGDTPYHHRGEEAGIVLQGTMQLWIGEKSFVVHEGDSFSYPSTTPHRYQNIGKKEAIVIWAITPPTF
jgi:transcriptional regulator with XRE-family HTH domain